MSSMGNSIPGGFQNIRWLRNHWARPIGPRGYYWFLTFEKSSDLHSLTKECQAPIDFPYYDLAPLESLHLTIDRIAYDEESIRNKIGSIEASAINSCRDMPAFDITIDHLSGVHGAIAFDVSPAERVGNLRNTLRSATLSIYPDAPVKVSESNPHITIAYANSDGISAMDAATAVDRMNAAIRRLDVTVTEAVMVLLEQHQRSYSWQVISRIPLDG
jgi:hypothetical protein